MASLDAIAAMREQADKDLRAVIEKVGGREAAERLDRAKNESIQAEYNEARQRQVMADILNELLESNVIREETGLEAIKGIGTEVADALRNAGYMTKADLREASNEELMKISGIGGATVRTIRKQL